MVQRKNSISRLLSSSSMPRFGKEETGKDAPIASTAKRLPRRRTTIQVSNQDSSDSDQHTSTLSRSTSSSAQLLRLTSRTGLRSLETSSDPSLRSLSKNLPESHGSPMRPKSSFRSKAPKPLKLDEQVAQTHVEQPLSSREATTPSYEEQFRRRRGDLLHRLGSSVPYMQAYDPTSLQW